MLKFVRRSANFWMWSTSMMMNSSPFFQWLLSSLSTLSSSNNQIESSAGIQWFHLWNDFILYYSQCRDLRENDANNVLKEVKFIACAGSHQILPSFPSFLHVWIHNYPDYAFMESRLRQKAHRTNLNVAMMRLPLQSIILITRDHSHFAMVQQLRIVSKNAWYDKKGLAILYHLPYGW